MISSAIWQLYVLVNNNKSSRNPKEKSRERENIWQKTQLKTNKKKKTRQKAKTKTKMKPNKTDCHDIAEILLR
jgi:hypothetical protein